MQMKAYMKRTGSYMETTRLTVTVICLLLLLVVSPLYGRRYDMAIVPNTDVNLAGNIRDVLNAAGGSVTNEVITFFQTRANINKWAKYKPVRHTKKFDLTDGEFQDARYGLNIPQAGNSNFGGNRIWTYELPAGGEYQPFRLSDFKSYYTDAVPPVTVSFPSNIYVNNDNSRVIYIDIDSSAEGMHQPSYNVLVRELFPTRQHWYIGVGIKNLTRNHLLWKTVSQPLESSGSNEFEITFPVHNNWRKGERVAVVALLCSEGFTGEPNDTPTFPESFYLCPTSNIGYKEFTLEFLSIITKGITLSPSDVTVVFEKRYGTDPNYGHSYAYVINYIRYSPKNETSGTLRVEFFVEVDDSEASGYIFDFGGSTTTIYAGSKQTNISRPTDSSGGVGSDNTDFVNITIYAEVQGDTDRQTIFSRDFNFYTQSWE